MNRGSRGLWALGALAAILAITAAWWAFALWPLSPEAPPWVARARATCFGVTTTGLPHTGGWLLLIGEPLGMIGLLLAVWGDAVIEGFRGLSRTAVGRVAMALSALLVAWGGQLAWARIGELRGEPFLLDGAASADAAIERVGRRPPPLRLVDQWGDTITLDRFRGRPVLLTFAYGHCRSVCPATVRRMLGAQRRMPDQLSLLVVTLDPWRDTPERLAHIAEGWGFGDRARVLGGSVEAVRAVLEAWRVPDGRDPHTGEIAHAPTVYAIGRDGRLAYRTAGASEQALVGLAERL
ncbi:MAG TPA: SCO family protein [Gemmatimonadales bacterium]